MDPELSVVIPAFNEEDNILPLYTVLKEVLDGMQYPYEIIFIDDGSTDKTYPALKKIHESDSQVKIIKFRKNFGQSAALRAGFDHAKGRIIITLDSDLQNDPYDIPKLVEKLKKEDFDVVCGWRYNRRDPFLKKIFSRMANWMRTKFTKDAIHDSGCTLRSYRQDCVKDLELFGELHRYIPAILQWKGYRIGELKVNHRERIHGTSKYSWKRLTKGFLDLLVISFWQKYSVRPMHIFGGFGFVMAFVGTLITIYLIVERIFYNAGLTDRPLFIMGFFLIVLGIQFLATGIIADILMKIYYGQSDRKNYLIEKILE